MLEEPENLPDPDVLATDIVDETKRGHSTFLAHHRKLAHGPGLELGSRNSKSYILTHRVVIGSADRSGYREKLNVAFADHSPQP